MSDGGLVEVVANGRASIAASVPTPVLTDDAVRALGATAITEFDSWSLRSIWTAAKTDDTTARGDVISDKQAEVSGVTWPKKVLSWWYAANTEASWKLLIKQVNQSGRLPLVTSIQSYCGHDISDAGEIVMNPHQGNITACQALFPELAKLGVRAELATGAVRETTIRFASCKLSDYVYLSSISESWVFYNRETAASSPTGSSGGTRLTAHRCCLTPRSRSTQAVGIST